MNTTNIVPWSVYWIIPRNRRSIKIWVSRVTSGNVSHFSEFEGVSLNKYLNKNKEQISSWNRNEKYLIKTVKYWNIASVSEIVTKMAVILSVIKLRGDIRKGLFTKFTLCVALIKTRFSARWKKWHCFDFAWANKKMSAVLC